MAFNWQTFKTRTLTAVIFAAVMLVGLLWNQWSFLVLFSIIHFGCWWEYLKLTEKIHQTSFHPFVKFGFMVMGYGLMLGFCGTAYQIQGYGIKENLALPISAAGFGLLLIGIFQKNAIQLKAFGMAMLGFIYISLSWRLMIRLSDYIDQYLLATSIVYSYPSFSNYFSLLPIVIIASIWINDTMAYIVGSLIGKTPLSSISPKKTWEGTMGGIILSIIAVGLLANTFIPKKFFIQVDVLEIEGYHWYIIAGIASIFGTFGDLLESKLKRMAGVKDSGSLMPGHGGFLDRFDSLLLATPFVWLYVVLLMR